jgi:hypothetical protein
MRFNLSDINSSAQCATWRKKINSIFNCNLSDSYIHWIFERLNIPKYPKYINGNKITYYKKSDVEIILYNGSLKNEINNIMAKTNKPKVSSIRTYSPLKPSDDITAQFSSYRNGNTSNKDNDDGLKYRNDENDMEKYSNYLINNVYMYENTVITQNELNQIIKENIIKIINNNIL